MFASVRANGQFCAMRLRHIVLLTLLILPMVLIAASALIDGDGWRGRLIAQIERWSGGDVSFAGPLNLRLIPPGLEGRGFTLKAGALPAIGEISAEKAELSLAVGQLLRGRIAIGDVTLVKPVLSIDLRKTGAGQSFEKMLASAPLGRIEVRGGSAAIRDANGAGHKVSAINGRIDLDAQDGISGRGAFTWRGEDVNLLFLGGRIDSRDGHVAFPLRVTVDAPLLNATLDGRVEFAANFAMTGSIEASSPSLRNLMRWSGYAAPIGNSLEDFQASGAFAWSGATIAIDSGSFTMDGNAADGALAFTLGRERPLVQGTLAFEALDLAPYLDEELLSELALPLIHHVDADFRLSSRTLVARGFVASDAAATLNLVGGVLVADIAQMSVCDSAASGRVKFDARLVETKLAAAGKLRRIALSPCVGYFAGDAAISGVADISFDLSGRGRRSADLLETLKGVMRGRAESGSVAFDLDRLLAQARNGDVDPVQARGGKTAFGVASADCALSGGRAMCDSLSIETALGVLAGGAVLDLRNMALGGGMTLSHPFAMASADNSVQPAPVQAFQIGGSWRAPEFEPASRPGLWPARPLELRPVKRQSRLAAPRMRD